MFVAEITSGFWNPCSSKMEERKYFGQMSYLLQQQSWQIFKKFNSVLVLTSKQTSMNIYLFYIQIILAALVYEATLETLPER